MPYIYLAEDGPSRYTTFSQAGSRMYGIHAAQPYIAQAMRKKAAIVMLQEIWIPRGSKFRVQRDFRRKYPEYECYIAAGSDVDLVADTDGDQVTGDGYNDRRAHITVVTFLHKLRRWVSGVWLKVELRQQGCSCTRIH